MQSFLEEIVLKVTRENPSLEQVAFILPSKRAGTFLKNTIANNANSTFFCPEIYSIEEFITSVSGLDYATNIEQLFELYNSYIKNTVSDQDNFYTFSKWGQTLLQDFNEIDRHLIDAKKLFGNLAAIQEINHWSMQDRQTQMMKDYLAFWNNLEAIYLDFNAALIAKGTAHQGLAYRRACEQLSSYLTSTTETFIFVGFNALNAAETQIIQSLLAKDRARIYWDTDTYFINDPLHDAGYFIRQHIKTWNYFKDKPLKEIGANYETKKNIQITGVPKNIAQSKYIGSLLKDLQLSNPASIASTALILGDETLLNPILNSIPEEINAVNITMGYPLNKTPMANFFNEFIALYLYPDKRGWFYKIIISFLSNPYIKRILQQDSVDNQQIINLIKKNNWTYITLSKIKSLLAKTKLESLFFETQPTPQQYVSQCLAIISELKLSFIETNDTLGLEYLYRFYNVYNQLFELVKTHSYINNLKALESILKELLKTETVDYQGDPLDGLQIMGMLESRNLDFETVIISSVNEGILPSGKSGNSFIPFDLKTRLALPTYKDKDAVYTYHFYRLLQRAKNIYIIYNTEPDVIEGREKSRLISQLLTDPLKAGDITEKVLAPHVPPHLKPLDRIQKDSSLMELIKNHAKKGFSPTSLSNYIRNPIDFYKRNLLKINDTQTVEETVAANTFGTIIHDTLEELYTPFIGCYLTEKGLTEARTKISGIVKKQFEKSYTNGSIDYGKNLIAYHVIIRYIENFIQREMIDAKNHNIKIISLEDSLSVTLDISKITDPVVLKGKLDRVDEKDGKLRIIDYKTGKVENANVTLADWAELSTDYKYSKAFQLLCYAYMFNNKQPIDSIESGIISFKNLSNGLLNFGTKEKGTKRETNITQETLLAFENELKKLVLEIFDPKISFTEKVV